MQLLLISNTQMLLILHTQVLLICDLKTFYYNKQNTFQVAALLFLYLFMIFTRSKFE